MATYKGCGRPGAPPTPPCPLQEPGLRPLPGWTTMQGCGCQAPQPLPETGTLGTLDGQERNGLGMECKPKWGTAAGRAVAGIQSPPRLSLVWPPLSLLMAWLVFPPATDEETEAVRAEEP